MSGVICIIEYNVSIMDYAKIYNSICVNAKQRYIEGYTEIHHIVPKCLGGNNSKENLVNLTAKEHFLCHKLLCEIYPENEKLLYAFWMMAIGKNRLSRLEPYNVSSREYKRLKESYIKLKKDKPISSQHKNKISQSNSKPVYQFDFKGNFIKKWKSATEAERIIRNKPYETHKNLPNNINHCCRGKSNSAYGFVWSYENKFLPLNKRRNTSL